MLKKLHISLVVSNLVVSKQLSTIVVDMRIFVTNFGNNLEICKKYAGNRVNEKGNIPIYRYFLYFCLGKVLIRLYIE